jgi:hypothetical protein
MSVLVKHGLRVQSTQYVSPGETWLARTVYSICQSWGNMACIQSTQYVGPGERSHAFGLLSISLLGKHGLHSVYSICRSWGKMACIQCTQYVGPGETWPAFSLLNISVLGIDGMHSVNTVCQPRGNMACAQFTQFVSSREKWHAFGLLSISVLGKDLPCIQSMSFQGKHGLHLVYSVCQSWGNIACIQSTLYVSPGETGHLPDCYIRQLAIYLSSWLLYKTPCYRSIFLTAI